MHIRHVAREFSDAIEPRPIDILIRIVVDQVAKRVDTQLFAEHLFPVGPHTGKIHDILFEDRKWHIR